MVRCITSRLIIPKRLTSVDARRIFLLKITRSMLEAVYISRSMFRHDRALRGLPLEFVPRGARHFPACGTHLLPWPVRAENSVAAGRDREAWCRGSGFGNLWGRSAEEVVAGMRSNYAIVVVARGRV